MSNFYNFMKRYARKGSFFRDSGNLKNALLLLIFIFSFTSSFAQNNVGIGTNTPNPYAILDLVSKDGTQGLLVPRFTTAQREALVSKLAQKDNGLLVYDTETKNFYNWNQSQATWILVVDKLKLDALEATLTEDINKKANALEVYKKTEIDSKLNDKADALDLTSLNQKVGSNETAIGNNTTAIATKASTSALNTLDGRVGTNESSITALENDKADNTTVSALGTRVGVNETAITNLGNDKADATLIYKLANSKADSTLIYKLANSKADSTLIYKLAESKADSTLIYKLAESKADSTLIYKLANSKADSALIYKLANSKADSALIYKLANSKADSALIYKLVNSKADSALIYKLAESKADSALIYKLANSKADSTLIYKLANSKADSALIYKLANSKADSALIYKLANSKADSALIYKLAESKADSALIYKLANSKADSTLIYKLANSKADSINVYNALDNKLTKTLATNKIFVGSADTATAVDLSGDAKIISTGELTIVKDAITSDKIKNKEVSLDKISPNTDVSNKTYLVTKTDGTVVWETVSSGDITLADDAVTVAKIKEGTDGQVLQTNGTDVVWATLPADKDEQTLLDVLGEGADAGANKITNLGAPTDNKDAVTKKYVDDATKEQLTTALASENILVGDGFGKSKAVKISGDATLSNTGALTIANDSIKSENILDGEVKTHDLASKAVTLGKISPNTDVSKQTYLVTKTDGTVVWETVSSGDITLADDAVESKHIKNGEVKTIDLANKAVTVSKINASTTDKQVLQTNGTDVVWATLTDKDEQDLKSVLGKGTDADGKTITNLGVPTVDADAATKKYVDDATKEQLTTALSSKNILVGNGSGEAQAVEISGDATLSNTGALTIANGSINSANIKDGEVKTDDLASKAVTLGKISPNSDLSNKTYLVTKTDGTVVWETVSSGDITLADNAVESKHIKNGEVKTIDLANKAVTVSKINASATDKQVLQTNGSDVVWATLPADKDEQDLKSVLGKGTDADGKRITNLGAPTDNKDAVTKKYVDDATKEQLTTALASENILVGDGFGKSKAVKISGDATLSNTGALTIANDAVTVSKINASTTDKQVLQTNGTDVVWATLPADKDEQDLKSVLGKGTDADGKTITNLGAPTDNKDAVTKKYVDDATKEQLTTALASENILVGDGFGKSKAVKISGDATLSNTGALTIANDAVTVSKINASTTDKQVLQTNGTDVVWATLPADKDEQDLKSVLGKGTDADGKTITNLGAPTDDTDASTKKYVDDATKEQLTTALASENILVGDGFGKSKAVKISGDATLSNTGTLTIANDAVTVSKINASTTDKQVLQTNGTDVVWATLPADKDEQDLKSVLGKGTDADGKTITNLGAPTDDTDASTKKYVDDATKEQLTTALASENILVGDGFGKSKAVKISGDATLSNTGALTISNNAVTSAKIVDNTITKDDIASGAVEANELASDAVTNTKLADNAVDVAEINAPDAGLPADGKTKYLAVTKTGTATALSWEAVSGGTGTLAPKPGGGIDIDDTVSDDITDTTNNPEQGNGVQIEVPNSWFHVKARKIKIQNDGHTGSYFELYASNQLKLYSAQSLHIASNDKFVSGTDQATGTDKPLYFTSENLTYNKNKQWDVTGQKINFRFQTDFNISATKFSTTVNDSINLNRKEVVNGSGVIKEGIKIKENNILIDALSDGDLVTDQRGNSRRNISLRGHKLLWNGMHFNPFRFTKEGRGVTGVTDFTDSALDKFKVLKVSKFTYFSNRKEVVGITTDNLETGFPDAVYTDDVEGDKHADYTQLIPYLIKAIQEQQKTIEKLTADVATGKASVKALTDALELQQETIAKLTKRVAALENPTLSTE